ncbi:MAG: type II toxin-antitoxin system MqsR family toxin [Sulfuricaulis sp.]|nr:type II toxin-antitoxin system MqsR family toxin [Sulfuricaulis sp.]
MDYNHPAYDLALVRVIAKKGNVYMEERANRDSRNLGYFEKDVADCICCLTSSDFYKSIECEAQSPNGRCKLKLRFDVYRPSDINSQGIPDDIYLKLRVTGGNNGLFVGSFKLQ